MQAKQQATALIELLSDEEAAAVVGILQGIVRESWDRHLASVPTEEPSDDEVAALAKREPRAGGHLPRRYSMDEVLAELGFSEADLELDEQHAADATVR